MFARRWNHSLPAEGQAADVNLTPLIDVSLVLVVILLLATPLAFESALGLRRADPTEPTAGVAAAPDRVKLDILTDRSLRVNGTAVELADLAGALGPLLEAAADKEVVVACAPAVSHGAFVQVLDIAQLSGAAGIAVVRD